SRRVLRSTGVIARRGRDRAAARILSAISSVYSRRPSRKPSRGLVTKSTAPSSSALRVTSELRSVSEDTITTGMGRRRISRSKKSRPSMRGISTSSVNTSGLCCLISSRATKGSGATATTSISGWLLMISVINLRTSAESSTHRTFIFFIALVTFFFGPSPAGCPARRRRLSPPVTYPTATSYARSACSMRHLVHRLAFKPEGVGKIRQVFGMPYKQQAAGLHDAGKSAQQSSLRRLVKINQRVAAENGVETLFERPCRRQQVEHIEFDHGSQGGLDPSHPGPRAGTAQEIIFTLLFGYGRDTLERIHAGTGRRNCDRVDVSRQN